MDSTAQINGHRHTLSEQTSPLPFFPRTNPPTPRGIIPKDIVTMNRSSSAGANVNPPSRSMVNGDSVEIPSRSTSLRRKPVPNVVSLPNSSLPASHPFAVNQYGGHSTPTSPGYRVDEELFFAPPRSGPLPPLRPRSVSPILPHTPVSIVYPPLEVPSPHQSPRIDQANHEQSNGYGNTSSIGHGSYQSHVHAQPATSYHGHGSQQGHSATDFGPDVNREESLLAREQALRDREESLRRREEIIRREEALRQREEELRAREEALSKREQASPVNPAPSPRPVHSSLDDSPRLPRSALAPSSRPVSFAGPYAANPSTTNPRYSAYRSVDPDSLQRPLPPIPDPSRTDLRDSIESIPAMRYPEHPSKSHPIRHGAAALAQKLKKNRRPISPPKVSVIQSHQFSHTDPSRPKEPFSVDRLPKSEEILEAGTLFLKDENGSLVCFGDLFPHPHSPPPIALPGDTPPGSENEELPPITKTVVFFIRHFWCGQCQDYTFASLSLLDPLTIRRAGIRVVVISNGSWKIIKAYRRILKCPFPIYVDGPRNLYHLLG